MTIVSSRRTIRVAVWIVLFACGGLMPSAGAAQTPRGTGEERIARAPDAFYDPPAHVADRPGVLLRSEPLRHVMLPAGMRGWRLQYTTTVDDKTPAVAVATVFAPVDPPAGPRPVIVWEHGTTGLLQKCMPSLTSTPAMGIPALDRIAKAGWVIVATDYSFAEANGPHPYLLGEGEARAGLDSVRAARQLPELTLDSRVVVWGHSQGGHSALWTGIVGPHYAPEIEIAGVAAIAPAADVASILKMNVAVDKRLGPYLARAYSRYYPDIALDRALRPEALSAGREIASLCGFFPPEDPRRITELARSFDGPALATDPALAARLAQNAANKPIAAPVVIAQGLKDAIVPPNATRAFVESRCAAGQQIAYWTFPELDHGTIVQPGAGLDEPLVSWTQARISGAKPSEGCTRQSF